MTATGAMFCNTATSAATENTMHLRVREAAAHVGLSKSSLDKMRCFGGGPAYFKVGRAVIYSVVELDAWLASQRRLTTWDGANDNQRIAARQAA